MVCETEQADFDAAGADPKAKRLAVIALAICHLDNANTSLIQKHVIGRGPILDDNNGIINDLTQEAKVIKATQQPFQAIPQADLNALETAVDELEDDAAKSAQANDFAKSCQDLTKAVSSIVHA